MSGKRASMAPEGPGVRPSAMPRPLAFLAASAGGGGRGGAEAGLERGRAGGGDVNGAVRRGEGTQGFRGGRFGRSGRCQQGDTGLTPSLAGAACSG